jgi:acetyl esterase
MPDLFDIDFHDFTYATPEGQSLPARLYRPRGRGPFPAMVDLHGGAWCAGSYDSNHRLNERIAAGGIVLLAVDYRLPPAGTYPASVADANYAIRWLKSKAEEYGSQPDAVGVMGTSAGGHLAVLSALKPADDRYASLSLSESDQFDARVMCVVALWPVIDPVQRFHEDLAKQSDVDADRTMSELGQQAHTLAQLDLRHYWVTEEAMIDGSPVLAIERGDKVETPDILYIQASTDRLHSPESMRRFWKAYRGIGGLVEEMVVDGAPYDFVRKELDDSEAQRAIQRAIAFIHEHAVTLK